MPLSAHRHSAGAREEILCRTFSLSNLSMYQVLISAGRHTDHPLPLSVLPPGPPWAAEADRPLRGEAALGLPPSSAGKSTLRGRIRKYVSKQVHPCLFSETTFGFSQLPVLSKCKLLDLQPGNNCGVQETYTGYELGLVTAGAL